MVTLRHREKHAINISVDVNPALMHVLASTSDPYADCKVANVDANATFCAFYVNIRPEHSPQNGKC